MQFYRGCTALVVLFASADSSVAGEILYIDRVEVRKTKADAKTPWDAFGGAPDLKISVERTSKPKGERHVTAPRENTFQAVFDRPALGVNEGDVVEIRVLDEDAAGDDEIGKISREITAEMLKSGEVELTFGQVDKLVLRFK